MKKTLYLSVLLGSVLARTGSRKDSDKALDLFSGADMIKEEALLEENETVENEEEENEETKQVDKEETEVAPQVPAVPESIHYEIRLAPRARPEISWSFGNLTAKDVRPSQSNGGSGSGTTPISNIIGQESARPQPSGTDQKLPTSGAENSQELSAADQKITSAIPTEVSQDPSSKGPTQPVNQTEAMGELGSSQQPKETPQIGPDVSQEVTSKVARNASQGLSNGLESSPKGSQADTNGLPSTQSAQNVSQKSPEAFHTTTTNNAQRSSNGHGNLSEGQSSGSNGKGSGHAGDAQEHGTKDSATTQPSSGSSQRNQQPSPTTETPTGMMGQIRNAATILLNRMSSILGFSDCNCNSS